MKRGSVLNRLADRYVGIPVLFAAAALKWKRKLPKNIQRVGIIASPTMGDTLLSAAAIRDLRDLYPAAHFIYFSAPSAAVAVDLLPAIDEIVPIKITDPRATVRAYRAAKLDLLVDFTSWQRITAFFSAASGARYKVGFRTAGQHRHYHYDLTVDHLRTRHEVDNFRALVRALGAQNSHQPTLKVDWADGLPSPYPDEEVVVFHAWASNDAHSLREWFTDRWVAVAKAIARPGTHFVLTGGPAQRAKSDALCAALMAAGVKASVFEGKGGFRSLVVLLQRASLLVSVNTGIMHLGAQLGTPTVAINGPNAAHRWGPYGPSCVSIEPVGGGGGFLHLGFEFKGNPPDTMERTPIEPVIEAANRIRRGVFAEATPTTAATVV